MEKDFFHKSVATLVMALWSMGISSAPLEKSGACLTSSRYTPTDVNWGTTYQNQIRPPTALYPVGTLPYPKPPDSSINCITVPTGLKAQLLASERTPGLNSTLPLAYIMEFTFDERGRVWAIEPRDYPYTHGADGMPDLTSPGITTSNGIPADRLAGRGRILILTDVDGDGSLDNYKVFYTGLTMPTSVELVKGGVIAIVPPSIYFIPANPSNPDTAGGTPIKVVDNMGSANQSYDAHGQTNSLTWGIDNFVYGNVGYNGCGTPLVTGGNSASGCSTGSIWRFKSNLIGSDTNLVQVYGPGNSGTNSHGIGQTEDGQWFSSKATVTNHSHHVVRLGSNVTNILTTNYSAGDSVHNFYPSTRDFYAWEGSTSRFFRFNGVDTAWATNESAVSGHDFYTATLLPSIYRKYSFVCEGMTHLCNQNYMTLNGSTWRANRIYGNAAVSNIFSGSDGWVAPLKVRTGPDGALWVLDWYNYLFLHNPATPATMAAWRNALREKSRVRIYRIVPADGSTQPVLNLSNASISDLVNALGHPNMLWRTTAQRLLLNRSYAGTERADLLTQLHGILNTDNSADAEFGTSPKVLHAMWVVAGMKQYTFNADPVRWDSTFKKLLLHPAWTVRRNALLAMPPTVASADAIVAQCAVNDVHAHVRIQALAALIANPAPSSPAQMVATYHNLDSYSTAAYTSAGSSKVTEVAGTVRPSTCPAYTPTVAIRSGDLNARSYARNDLRFRVFRNGFELKPFGGLPSGDMTIYDLRGAVVFRSTYNSSKMEWSTSTAKGLNLPVYFYSFRGVNGDKFDGRISLADQL